MTLASNETEVAVESTPSSDNTLSLMDEALQEIKIQVEEVGFVDVLPGGGNLEFFDKSGVPLGDKEITSTQLMNDYPDFFIKANQDTLVATSELVNIGEDRVLELKGTGVKAGLEVPAAANSVYRLAIETILQEKN